MSKPELPGDPWQYGTWEGSEIAELLRGHSMSLAERLAWIEEMSEVVASLATKSGREQGAAGRRPETDSSEI